MESPNWVEWIGYAASVLVAGSLMMRNVVRLRWINGVGALTFAIYGWLIGSWPVAGMNAFIVGINLYHLSRMRKTETYFRLLRLSADDEYLSYFLARHKQDISGNQPSFDFEPAAGDWCWFVLRDTLPAGVLIAAPGEDGLLRVKLDYVLPEFRDFALGQFVWHANAPVFVGLGVRLLEATGGSAEHRGYLARMGFAEVGGDRWTYRL